MASKSALISQGFLCFRRCSSCFRCLNSAISLSAQAVMYWIDDCQASLTEGLKSTSSRASITRRKNSSRPNVWISKGMRYSKSPAPSQLGAHPTASSFCRNSCLVMKTCGWLAIFYSFPGEQTTILIVARLRECLPRLHRVVS